MSGDGPAPREPGGRLEGLSLTRGELVFRLLVEAVEDYAIFVLSPEGNVLTWNAGAQRIKGYAADEIIGQHFSRFYTPAEREANRPMRLLEAAAERGRIEDEGWRVRKDGTRFWADVILTALRDADGHPPYAYAKITRDLTERRAAEERERALFVEREKRAAAEGALATRDRFLSIASHELKTPAASLRLTVESLERAQRAGRLDAERLQTGLRRLDLATGRLGALVDQLLDVSRLQGAASPPPMKRTDLVPIVAEVVDRFDAVDGGGRIRLSAPHGVWIEGDASLLDQVVTNLVDNAVKYSSEGAPVEVEVAGTDDGATIRVADRGVGFDVAASTRLFEAFGRGDNVAHIPGLGLGLHISSQAVERHGGRIEATGREDGAGSIVTVWLPRGAADG